MGIKKFTTLCLLLFSIMELNAQWSILKNDSSKHERWNLLQRFTPQEWNASNFASEKEMQWFKDAKYGMFIHFGLSTYIGKDLSWGMCYTRKAPDQGRGLIADSIWTKYPAEFALEKFDAKLWVEIAKKSGFKYIVAIAKHHDGFHLWNTKYSDFNIMNTPFGRDYLKELADACHAAGMKFGIYYSQRDWYHPDYAPVDTALIDRIPEPPFYKAKPAVKKVVAGPSHQKYIDYQFNAVKELCTNYGKVDVFWFDACWWGEMFTADMWESEKLTRMIRQLQPGVIINNRASIPGDFDTPEQKIGAYQSPRAWESCMTLCGSWSWSATPVKSKKTLIKMLTSTADGNGNMLLSWGPKWDGAFDPVQVDRLEELGVWLKQYGHTIYNTKGGPWYPADWGGSAYRNKTAFLHITSATTEKLMLPAVNNKIISAKCLTGGTVSFQQTSKAVTVDLSKVKRNVDAVIIELTFQNKISEMASAKSTLSKFSDPVYGKIISEKLAFTSGSNTEIIDLGKMFSVTGVDIRNKNSTTKTSSRYIVEVSEDAKKWMTVEQTEKAFQQWEVTVAEFNAGILLPGVKARYIKISRQSKENEPLQLEHVFVYGK
jgi:alpha-L-fucosidase